MIPVRSRRPRAALPAVLATLGALVVGACARADASLPAPAPEPSPDPTTATTPAPPRQSVEELEALYRARMDSARTRYTEADVRFMTGMIHHHAQAIDMARLAPTHGASPAIQRLAARIINGQRDEIATMEEWLRERGLPVPASSDGHTVHGGHDDAHAVHMPGMLTPAQMAQLEAARGAAFDRRFLELMIQHHQGAVTMVHELFATDGAAQDEVVFRFASDVQVDQATEIARMERMLDEL